MPAGTTPVIGLFVKPDDLDPIDARTALSGGATGWLANPVGTDRYAYAGNHLIYPGVVTINVNQNGNVGTVIFTGVGTGRMGDWNVAMSGALWGFTALSTSVFDFAALESERR